MIATIGHLGLTGALAKLDAARSRPSGLPSRQPAQPTIADSLRDSLASARKAQARDDIRHLKEQINDLALVAALDPTGLATMLNGLSRRLATIARDYADAGDTASRSDQVAESHRDTRPPADTATPEAPAPQPLAADDQLPLSVDVAPEVAAQAYATAIPPEKKADDDFSTDVKTLRNRLKVMFEGAMQMAAAEDGMTDDLKQLASSFSDTQDTINKALKTIASWSAPTTGPTVPSLAQLNLLT